MLVKPATIEKRRQFLTEVVSLFPPRLRKIFEKIPPPLWDEAEEIRLRVCRPLMIVTNQKDYYVTQDGRVTPSESEGLYITTDDTFHTLQLISNSSLYAVEEELKQGYLTLPGGHRVGLAGKVILEGGLIKTQTDIAGFNFRLSRQVLGAADNVLPFIIDGKRQDVYNTMVISPPKCGKTTLIRDIARQISNGVPKLGFKGQKVGIVDERSEIAGTFQGIPQNDIGVRTDVLDSCPKAAGVIMLIRSMSPQVIITDEIGREEDAKAIEEAVNAGVKVITTVHGKDFLQVSSRPTIKKLLGQMFFERFIVLGNSQGAGTVEQIMDANLEKLQVSPFQSRGSMA